VDGEQNGREVCRRDPHGLIGSLVSDPTGRTPRREARGKIALMTARVPAAGVLEPLEHVLRWTGPACSVLLLAPE
jgi:hypothetical protein